jgi:hypothetical protein
MTDEDLIFDRHPFADEAVTRDFAPGTNPRSSLDFDKRPQTAVIPDFAPI